MGRNLGKTGIGRREALPDIGQRYREVKVVVEVCNGLEAVGSAMDEEGNAAAGGIRAVNVLERDEVGFYGAGVLGWAGLLPSEGLAGGECER